MIDGYNVFMPWDAVYAALSRDGLVVDERTVLHVDPSVGRIVDGGIVAKVTGPAVAFSKQGKYSIGEESMVTETKPEHATLFIPWSVAAEVIGQDNPDGVTIDEDCGHADEDGITLYIEQEDLEEIIDTIFPDGDDEDFDNDEGENDDEEDE